MNPQADVRVLHVMESTIGGTRRHIVDVARAQKSAGLDVHLAVSAEREPAFHGDVEALRREGIDVTLIPMSRAIRPWRDAPHFAQLCKLMRRIRPDIVHTHSSKGGALGRTASLATGIGVRVHTPHTFAFLLNQMFGAKKRAVYRAIESWLSQRTECVIAVSESEGEIIRRSGVVPEGRVRVVPNGIDPRPFLEAEPLDRVALEAELGIPPDAPLAGVLGLLNIAKGQDLAIRALAEPGGEAVHLLLAGHGECETEWRALAAELGVADRAHFLGWRDDAPALLATLDVLLLPSRWESMPYILLESMAAGLPVLAAEVSGALELVVEGETGRVVPREDPVALARVLGELVEAGPEGRDALGAAGRKRVLECFTLDAMVDGLLEVYRDFGSGPGGD